MDQEVYIVADIQQFLQCIIKLIYKRPVVWGTVFLCGTDSNGYQQVIYVFNNMLKYAPWNNGYGNTAF